MRVKFCLFHSCLIFHTQHIYKHTYTHNHNVYIYQQTNIFPDTRIQYTPVCTHTSKDFYLLPPFPWSSNCKDPWDSETLPSKRTLGIWALQCVCSDKQIHLHIYVFCVCHITALLLQLMCLLDIFLWFILKSSKLYLCSAKSQHIAVHFSPRAGQHCTL